MEKRYLSRATTPDDARDEIAAMIFDASTELMQRPSFKKKDRQLGIKLADIAERIAAIQYKCPSCRQTGGNHTKDCSLETDYSPIYLGEKSET